MLIGQQVFQQLSQISRALFIGDGCAVQDRRDYLQDRIRPALSTQNADDRLERIPAKFPQPAHEARHLRSGRQFCLLAGAGEGLTHYLIQ
jgi:hypothetical protein